MPYVDVLMAILNIIKTFKFVSQLNTTMASKPVFITTEFVTTIPVS